MGATFMKIARAPHKWLLSPAQAIAVQRKMASRVVQARRSRECRLVAGLDAAFSTDDELCFAAVVLWDMRAQQMVEQHTAIRPLVFPYIPGLLSFREVPALLAALRKLKQTPNALMCDGQGVAHPRRFGIACHLGVVCDLPAVGCAKSRLIGTHREPLVARGSQMPLTDKGELIGTVLRTQTGVKPVYVSVGHKADLSAAAQMVMDCAVKYRLPEPTRLADQLVAAAKQKAVGSRKIAR